MKHYWEIEVLPWIIEEVIDVIFFTIVEETEALTTSRQQD
jgi:hypothetical protein